MINILSAITLQLIASHSHSVSQNCLTLTIIPQQIQTIKPRHLILIKLIFLKKFGVRI